MGIFSRVAAAAVAGLLAFSAQASILTVTFNGTVSSGNDTTNLFGMSGGSLVGQSYNLVYTLDSGIMNVGGTGGTDPGSYHDLSKGGNQPTITATMTINSIAQTFASTYYTAETRQLGSNPYQSFQIALYTSNSNYIFQSIYAPNVYSSLDPTSDINFVGAGNGSFNVGGEMLGLQSTSLTQTSAAASAVPEPATWGMMLIGFGAIGASLRGRRSNAALADRRRIG